ncbi:hypothetical protein [Stratiformator vulcanicus]|uniref:Uncharacterized protein n=1 Tax=Stratiformator vulcanicus TaxID=2527980 RepID=A0A517R5I3_9PLAN|nr:hypothetical protein [Stratiformator vulcanicus]QDT39095.1 hypothetical protein Pan189_34970 [Stratiformator vulcanicus]
MNEMDGAGEMLLPDDLKKKVREISESARLELVSFAMETLSEACDDADGEEGSPMDDWRRENREREDAAFSSFSAADIRQFIKARRGRHAAEKIDNAVWKALIETEVGPYAARSRFNLALDETLMPSFAFDRFGMSSTIMPDGREIFIAGEHEDYYDPDFYIYNDVIVRDPSGAIDIYGYPETVFPPTDFHSATRIESDILIIGCLGYQEQREEKTTPVFLLNCETFEIRKVKTTGKGPGWIHNHKVSSSPREEYLTVVGGLRHRDSERDLIANEKRYRLDLKTWHWTRHS